MNKRNTKKKSYYRKEKKKLERNANIIEADLAPLCHLLQ